jgi:hypothetical protein
MHIKVADLRQACGLLLDHLEQTGGPMLDVGVDYYWWITPEECYEVNSTPSRLVMGQLSDDWSELKLMLSSEREPVNAGLVWLSAILRRAGEQTLG